MPNVLCVDDSQFTVYNYTALNNFIILNDKLLLMVYTEILSQYIQGGTEEMQKNPLDRQNDCE